MVPNVDIKLCGTKGTELIRKISQEGLKNDVKSYKEIFSFFSVIFIVILELYRIQRIMGDVIEYS